MTREELRQELREVSFPRVCLFFLSRITTLLAPVTVGWVLGVLSVLSAVQALGLHR